MFRFHIERELRNSWADVVSAHANLFLTPLRGQFRSATISLRSSESWPDTTTDKTAKESAQAAAIFTCAIKISGLNTIACDHTDPHIAIGQAMARARRTLARHAQIRDCGGL